MRVGAGKLLRNAVSPGKERPRRPRAARAALRRGTAGRAEQTRLIACLDVRDGKLAKSVQVRRHEGHRRSGAEGARILRRRSRRTGLLRHHRVERQTPHHARRGRGGGASRCSFRCRSAAASDPSPMRPICASPAPRRSTSTAPPCERPALIAECADAIGNQNIVLSMDIKAVDDAAQCPSGYEIVIHGGRTPNGPRRARVGARRRTPRRRRTRDQLDRRRRHPRGL